MKGLVIFIATYNINYFLQQFVSERVLFAKINRNSKKIKSCQKEQKMYLSSGKAGWGERERG